MCHWLAKGGGEAFSRPLLGGTPGGWGGERPAHSRPEQILPVTSSPRGFRTQLLQHSFWPLSPRLSHQMTIKLQKLSSLTHRVPASIHTGSSLSGKARKDDLLGRGRARVGGGFPCTTGSLWLLHGGNQWPPIPHLVPAARSVGQLHLPKPAKPVPLWVLTANTGQG